MSQAPWDYLLQQWNADLFPDIFWPFCIAVLALFIGQIVVYNVRTRQLHKFEPLVGMQEWLLWTGVVTFGLLAVMSLFQWYFLLVLTTLVIGLGTYVWIRFVYFPPIIAAYNQHLRRTRFFSQEKYKHPEATIRQRSSQRPRSNRGSRKKKRR
ncbi:MAG TPA: hypothetical protein VIF84_04590 [Candidatus Limnocylindrales bacterium]